MQINRPDYYDNLDKTYLKIWNLLRLGLSNRDAPFHISVFIKEHRRGLFNLKKDLNEKKWITP